MAVHFVRSTPPALFCEVMDVRSPKRLFSVSVVQARWLNLVRWLNPTRHGLAVIVLICVASVSPANQCPAQAPAPTDYIVLLDTSSSMNRAKKLEKVKNALMGIIREHWLDESKKGVAPSKLFLYQFSSKLSSRREFLIDDDCLENVGAYISGIKARGRQTAIISSLKAALEDIPQICREQGRMGRREFCLLTDGVENVEVNQLMDQKALQKLLSSWGQEVETLQRDDFLFLLRIGKLASTDSSTLEEMKNQVKSSSDGGAPVAFMESKDDMRDLGDKLRPPIMSLRIEASTLSLVTQGVGKKAQVKLTLSGSRLKERPDTIRIMSELRGLASHTSIGSKQIEITKTDWAELKAGNTVQKLVVVSFAPPAGRDIEEIGALHVRLDATGRFRAKRPVPCLVTVTSKGKAEVRVSGMKPDGSLAWGAKEVGRIDVKRTDLSRSLTLKWDSAVEKRSGAVILSASSLWPSDASVKLMVEGQEVNADGIALRPSMDEVKVVLVATPSRAYPLITGAVVLESVDCQLVGVDGEPCGKLTIPWEISAERIPAAIVTLDGDFQINDRFEIQAIVGQSGTTVREQIAFKLLGEAGAEAKRRGFKISLTDREPPIPREERDTSHPRDPKMTVHFDGEAVLSADNLDSATVDITIPHCPPGDYHGIIELTIENALLTAEGIGEPVESIELYWLVRVVAPGAVTVAVAEPASKQLQLNVALTSRDEPTVSSLPVQLDFGTGASEANANVLVSVSPAKYSDGRVRTLSSSDPRAVIPLMFPSDAVAGEHNISIIFQGTNCISPDGSDHWEHEVSVNVLPPDVVTVSISAPTVNQTKLDVQLSSDSPTTGVELPIQVEFGPEAAAANATVEVSVSPSELVKGETWRLDASNPAAVIPLEIARRSGSGNRPFAVVFKATNCAFTDGSTQQTTRMELRVAAVPIPELTLVFPEGTEDSVFRVSVPWNEKRRQTISIPIEVEHNAEARAQRCQATARSDSLGEARIDLSVSDSSGTIKLEIPAGQYDDLSTVIEVATDDAATRFADGVRSFKVIVEITGVPLPTVTIHRDGGSHSDPVQLANKGHESTETVTFKWNATAKRQNSHLRVETVQSLSADMGEFVTTDVADTSIGTDTESIDFLTSFAKGGEPGEYSAEFVLVGEGDLQITYADSSPASSVTLQFVREVDSAPWPLWKKIAFIVFILGILTAGGKVFWDKYQGTHGPPRFLRGTYATVGVDEELDETVQLGNKRSYVIGNGGSRHSDLSMKVTIKAARFSAKPCVTILIAPSDVEAQITDEMGSLRPFHSGDAVAPGDELRIQADDRELRLRLFGDFEVVDGEETDVLSDSGSDLGSDDADDLR